MNPGNNDATDTPLKLGLIADGDELARLSAASAVCPNLRLHAQSGMSQADALPEVPWFDDTRVLIAQSGVEAIVLGRSTRTAIELGQMAVEKGLHIWRTPPLGRTFAEAAEAVEQARRQRVVYRVASWWSAVEEGVRAAMRRREGFKPLYSEVHVAAAGPAMQSWRASAVDACGGVLAADAYDLLEALVALRGLPESVSASIGKCRRAPGQAPRETEDVGNVLIRFDAGGLAGVRATWDIPPYFQYTLHHASDATLVLRPGSVSVRSAEDALIDDHPLPTVLLPVDLARFATSVRTPENQRPASSALDRHLAVSALLEAIYLSARTGQPETPRKLYEVLGLHEPNL